MLLFKSCTSCSLPYYWFRICKHCSEINAHPDKWLCPGYCSGHSDQNTDLKIRRSNLGRGKGFFKRIERRLNTYIPLSAEVNKEWNYGPTSTLPIYLPSWRMQKQFHHLPDKQNRLLISLC
jgi:hypothetical protein